jgi:hypothetical protein
MPFPLRKTRKGSTRMLSLRSAVLEDQLVQRLPADTRVCSPKISSTHPSLLFSSIAPHLGDVGGNDGAIAGAIPCMILGRHCSGLSSHSHSPRIDLTCSGLSICLSWTDPRICQSTSIISQGSEMANQFCSTSPHFPPFEHFFSTACKR